MATILQSFPTSDKSALLFAVEHLTGLNYPPVIRTCRRFEANRVIYFMLGVLNIGRNAGHHHQEVTRFGR